MCTVSLVPLPGGFRLMCNRDERSTRPAALPPRRVRAGGYDAILPIDPQSGGTWIGVNDAAIAIALLNRTPPIEHGRCAEQSTPPLRSRGDIVPRLLRAGHPARLVTELHTIDYPAYPPFRVIAAWNRRIMIATWEAPGLRIVSRRLTRPCVLTSSSLGDRHAERVRIPLFSALVVRAADPLVGQREFHDHQWPGCGAFSVRMQRPGARTVSRSLVDVRHRLVSLTYEPLPPEA